MIRRIRKDIIDSGLTGEVLFERLDTHAVRYLVTLNGVTFDDGYFIGEVGSNNTKEAMIMRWVSFLLSLKTKK